MKRLFVRILARFLNMLPDRSWIITIFNHAMCLGKTVGLRLFCGNRKIQTSLTQARRALILAPHMDDETIGCGGMIRKQAEGGARVTVLCLTDGALGLSGRERTRRRNDRVRETRAAASLLGIQRLYFLDQPDGYLRATSRLVDGVRRIIARERPDQIYLPYPYDSHVDHKQAFVIFAKAVERLPLIPWSAYFCQICVPIPWPDISLVVDISDVLPLKKQALRLFRSQSQFPFSAILHLQRCQAYLSSLRAKSVELFCRFDRAGIPDIARNLQANGVSIKRYFQVGLYALRSKKWA